MGRRGLWFVLALAACNGGTDTASFEDITERGDVLGINITPTDPAMQVGDEIALVATAFYADTTTEDISSSVTWVSSNPRVLSVDSAGTASAISSGVAHIIVTSDIGMSAKIEATVVSSEVAITSVVLQPAELQLEIGGEFQMVANATYEDDNEGNISPVCAWRTLDPAIAAVSERGVVTALAEGTTSVEGACRGKIASSSVDVAPVGGLSGDPDLHITDMVARDLQGVLSYEVTIQNDGDVPANEFFVDIHRDLDAPPVPGETDWDETGFVFSLGAKQSTVLFIDMLEPPSGTFSSYAVIDPEDFVLESNEANNIYGPIDATVAGQSVTGPALVIQAAEAVAIEDDVTTLYEVRVANGGDLPAFEFWVDVFADPPSFPDVCDLGEAFELIDELGPGSVQTLFLEIPDVPTGSDWASIVWVDSCDDVAEDNEADNSLTVPVSAVVLPDPDTGLDTDDWFESDSF